MMRPELTILIPCLDERATIVKCIHRARMLLAENRIDGEILVSCNGSTDGSQEIAKRNGARVVNCPVHGYGAALLFGIRNARGEFTIIADADECYRLNEAMPLIETLRNGADVCLGSRLKGGIERGAMPFKDRFFINPAINTIARMLFQLYINDIQCGMRAFRTEAVRSLPFSSTGMEWASEMVIKAKMAGLNIKEARVRLYNGGGDRKPHLEPWHNGWRHLRLMILHAPRVFFTAPGLFLASCGLLGLPLAWDGSVYGNGVTNIGVMAILAISLLCGMQLFFSGMVVESIAIAKGITPPTLPGGKKRKSQKLSSFSLFRVLAFSLALFVLAVVGLIFISHGNIGTAGKAGGYLFSAVMIALSFLAAGTGLLAETIMLPVASLAGREEPEQLLDHNEDFSDLTKETINVRYYH